jgi:hypothetical protein
MIGQFIEKKGASTFQYLDPVHSLVPACLCPVFNLQSPPWTNIRDQPVSHHESDASAQDRIF